MNENVKKAYLSLSPEAMQKVAAVISALLDMQQHPEDAPKTLRERYALALHMAGFTEEEAAVFLESAPV